jgi:hypothetical protein
MSLPPNFESEMSGVKIEQTRRSMNAAMSYADHATAKLMKSKSGVLTGSGQATGESIVELLRSARTKMEEGRRRLEKLAERTNNKARVFGILAATEKRCAEVYFSFSRADPNNEAQYRADWMRLLQQARQHYWSAFQSDRANSWGVVQYISLDVLLRNLRVPDPDMRIERHEEHNQPDQLWTMAHVTSLNDLRSKDEMRIRWALSNLIELYLISPLVGSGSPLAADYPGRAVQRAQDLIDRAGPDAFEVYSTRRQLLRYDDWYWEIANIEALSGTLSNVLGVFPKPGLNDTWT